MRRYLMHAPWWVLSVATGVPFGAAMMITSPVLHSIDGTTGVLSPTVDIVSGAVAGVVFGAAMGPITARRNRRARSAVGPLSGEDFTVVLRAARRGPVPADPQLRRAAGRLARFHLDELTRNLAFSLAVATMYGVLVIYVVVTTSGWFWLAALLFAYPITSHLWLSRRLRRRVERLHADDGAEPSPITATPPPNRR